MNLKQWLILLGFLVLSHMAGIIGSFFTVSEINGWYASLTRPAYSPPNWVFGPVWTTLYTLMGIAAFLVWRKGSRKGEVQIALVLFCIQLFLNTLWSIIFFGVHSLLGAFVEIMFLWFAILATIIFFAKVSRLAAWLLVPYLLWVGFAASLNFSFWRLNV